MYASFAREHPELAGRLRRGEADSALEATLEEEEETARS